MPFRVFISFFMAESSFQLIYLIFIVIHHLEIEIIRGVKLFQLAGLKFFIYLQSCPGIISY